MALLLAVTQPDPDAEDTAVGLARSAAFFRAVIDSAAEAIVVFDPQGLIQLWNPAAEQLFGWTAAEAVGRFAPHIPPEEQAETLERLHLIDEGQEQIAHRSNRRRKDGSLIELSVLSSPLRAGDGTAGGVVSVIRDVTDLFAAEQARTEAERLFRAAFEHAPNGVALTGADGAFLDVNPAACKMMRRSREELLVTTVASMSHPDDLDVHLEARARALTGESEGFRLEKRYLAPDGSTIWVEQFSAVVRDDRGKPQFLVTQIVDVTARNEAERARVAAERLFRSAFENAPNGVMLTDVPGAFFDVNRAACEILQRSREDLLATTFAAITHPDDLEASLEPRARALAGEIDSYSLEKRYLAPDGTTIWAELSASLIRDDRNEPQYFVVQLVDVTARKVAERTLAEAAAQLEAVSRVVHQLLTADDARTLVCAAIAEIAGADAVLLSEQRAEGSIEVTAATLPELVGNVFAPTAQSHAMRRMLGGESLFIADTRASKLVSARLAIDTGARSTLFEPVRGEHGVVGGLTIVWRNAVAAVEPRTLATVRLLAAEAALAIERGDLLRRLAEQALTDELTGLPNRRAFAHEIEREIARARRSGSSLTVAMIDLDRFKRFNDRHGHIEGDRLLRASADAWRAQLRGSDTLARIGGDEFVALLPDSDNETARHILDRLRLAMPDGATCSIGFANWDGNESADELRKRADSALYTAKNTKRNGVSRSD
jgi:diguanylate cyclase (GGDEF)-like protein/PAS domain S-box-containing protein